MHDSYNIKTADDINGVLSPFDNNFFTGHKQETAILCSLINNQRQHHALIFEGEQGLGKASLAIHFAYSLFAYEKNNEHFNIKIPDKKSVIWRQMEQNIYPGFLYLSRSYDSNAKRFKNYIAAEEIKQISKMLQHSVSDSGQRIIIIDNLGDLNQYSANALLKMLEEPPANTLFILISHLHKPVLATVRSRCLTIRFKPLATEQLKT
ncbi:MAG: AAA family ATPase, partial [Alphaproteobacteria bacterium]|nr:AAA family ATPase [Alphaproteobacteria bacterium]